MSELDVRPPVWVGHVVLETDRLNESADFMLTIGMRVVYQGAEAAVFELRGGTHLILIAKTEVVPGMSPANLFEQPETAALTFHDGSA